MNKYINMVSNLEDVLYQGLNKGRDTIITQPKTEMYTVAVQI